MSFDVHQEPDALPRGRVLAVFAISAGITVLTIWLAGRLLATLAPTIPRPTPPAVAPHQIATVEQTPIRGPARGLDLAAAQRDALMKWRWVDRDAGIAEIPIDVAIDLTLAGAANEPHSGGGTR